METSYTLYILKLLCFGILFIDFMATISVIRDNNKKDPSNTRLRFYWFIVFWGSVLFIILNK